MHRSRGLLSHPQPCGEEHTQGGGGGGDRDGEGAPGAGSQRHQEGPHRHQGEDHLHALLTGVFPQSSVSHHCNDSVDTKTMDKKHHKMTLNLNL